MKREWPVYAAVVVVVVVVVVAVAGSRICLSNKTFVEPGSLDTDR
jgi:hypothetical protein